MKRSTSADGKQLRRKSPDLRRSVWRKTMKRWITLTLCLLLLSGCAPAPEQPPREYRIQIQSAGGLPLAGITLRCGSNTAITDADGVAMLTLPAGAEITLEQLPLGYSGEEAYRLTEEQILITLTSAPIPPEQGSPTQLAVGDIMYDFTLESVNKGTVTLSEVLREKEVVLLTFWYSDCQYCSRTFPLLEVACSSEPRAQIIAVNPVEDRETVAQYQQKRRCGFPMAPCPSSWRQIFGINRYPAIVVIDRYGMITQTIWGTPGTTDQIRQILSAHTGSDYRTP